MADDLRIQVLLRAMDKASGPLRAITGGSMDAADALRSTRNQLKELNLAQQNITGFRKTKSAAAESAVALQAAKQRAKQLRDEMAATEAPTKKAAAAYARAEREVTRLKNAHLTNLYAVRKRTAALTQAGVSIKGLNTEQRRLSTATAGAAFQLYKQKYALQQVAQQTNRLAALERARQANLATRSAVGGKLMGTVALAAAGGYALSRSLGSGLQFGKDLQAAANTANMSNAQKAVLRRSVIDNSKATHQSIQTMLAGESSLIAAGLSDDVAMRSGRTLGRVTTATGADMGDIAQSAFTMTKIFGIAPEKLERSFDILSQAGKRGSFELKGMAGVIPTLGASFSSLGLKGNEGLSTMGSALQVAKLGAGSDEQAANNLQNFMTKVLSPQSLKNAQEKFGVDLYGIIQKAQKEGSNPFEKSIEAIHDAVGDDQKKLGELFQDMQVQGFLKPIMQHWEEYKDIKRDALAATGTIDRDFRHNVETAAQKIEDMKNAAGRANEAFSKALQPSIGKLSKALVPLLDKLATFIENNPKLVAGIASVTAGLVALRIATLGTRYAWTFMVGGLLNTATKIPAVATAVEGLTVAMAAVSLPVWGTVAAVTVLVGFLAWKYWGPIKAYVTGFGSALAESATPAVKELAGALAPLKNALDGVLSPMKATTDQLNQFSSAGSGFGKTVGFVFKAAIDPLKKTVDLLNVILVLLEKFKASTPTATFGQRVTAARNPLGTFIHALATPLPGPGVHWNTGAATDRLPPAPIHWNTGAATDRIPATVIDRSAPLQAPGSNNAGNTIHVGGITVVQQPGEDGAALARRVRAEIEAADRAKAAARGSRLRDPE